MISIVNKIVLILLRLVLLLLYDMKNEHKTINISWYSVSLHIIGDENFRFKLEWRIQNINPNSLKMRVEKVLSNNFCVEIMKKTHLELKTFQQPCSMTSAYLGRMCVRLWSYPS